MSAVDEWIKEHEYRYNMNYSISVPKASGLKILLKTAEEIYTETGLSPDEHITLLEDIKTYVSILYDRTDAKRLLNGEISEEEYLDLHVICFTQQDITLDKTMEGFPEHPGRFFLKNE